MADSFCCGSGSVFLLPRDAPRPRTLMENEKDAFLAELGFLTEVIDQKAKPKEETVDDRTDRNSWQSGEPSVGRRHDNMFNIGKECRT